MLTWPNWLADSADSGGAAGVHRSVCVARSRERDRREREREQWSLESKQFQEKGIERRGERKQEST